MTEFIELQILDKTTFEKDTFIIDNEFDCHSGWLENKILRQYTGLKDKNGKKIYEGDIIESNEIMYDNSNRKKAVVIFQNGCFSLKGSCSLSIVTNPPIEFEPEVIGNIYENPELIK